MTARSSSSHDPATVLAIAVIVYVGAKVVHEGVGHGAVCELVGGDLRAFTSSWCDCDSERTTEWGVRAIKAGGTLANLLVGAACFAALKPAARLGGPTLYFVWLSAAVHLFMGSGYMLVDPLFRFGDWGRFLTGLEPAIVWTVVVVALGLAIMLGTFFALRGPLAELLGGGDPPKRQARILCWLPYGLVAGVVMTAAALLNPLGPTYAWTSALATLGGTYMLVWIPASIDRLADTDTPRRIVHRSAGWLIAGLVATVLLFTALGPGIFF